MIDAKEHFGLVAKIALEFIHNNEKVEDTYEFSDGLLGLTKAIQGFNSSNKCQFSTYAWWCIKNTIISGLKQRKKGIQFTTNWWDFEEFEEQRHFRDFCDIRELTCLNDDRKNAIKKVTELINLMPSSSKKIAVVGWFLQGRNLTDIGKELGVRQARAQQYKNEGVKELRQIAYKTGIDFD